MVNPVVQQKLNDLLQNFGRNSLSDPVILESLIRDKIGEDSQDATLLILALNAGIPQAIADGHGDGAVLARRIREQSFVSEVAAESAVKAWAEALNIVVSFDSQSVPLGAADLPPLPHIEVEVPVHAPHLPVDIPSRPAARPRSRPWVRVAGLITILVLGVAAGVAGYLVGRKPDSGGVVRRTTVKGSSTAGKAAPSKISLPTLNANANQPAPFTGTITLPPGSSAPAPNTTAPVAPSADTMAAYNVKLAAIRRQFDSSSSAYYRETQALSSESDPDTMMDRAAAANDSFSQVLSRLATELDTAAPPAEAASINRQMASNMRQLSSLVQDIAQAAKDRDTTKFSENRDKLAPFTETAGNQLAAMVSGAGYDPDQFARDGTLIKD